MKNKRGNKLLALEDAFKGQADSGVLQIEGGFKLLTISRKTQSEDFYTPPPIGTQFPGQ
jgi:hypothetical protein